MTLAWWLGFVTVCGCCVWAWRSEEWWRAMAFYAQRYRLGSLAFYCGRRAWKLESNRIRRERERRQAALAGEWFIAEIRHKWDGLA